MITESLERLPRSQVHRIHAIQLGRPDVTKWSKELGRVICAVIESGCHVSYHTRMAAERYEYGFMLNLTTIEILEQSSVTFHTEYIGV